MPKEYPSFGEFNDAVNRITQLESNLQKNVDQTNKALMSAKNSDGNLEKRLGDLERRLDQTRDHINVILQKAKDYDGGLDKRLGAVETRLDQTRDHLNTILAKAKDYDTGLDRRLGTVESSLKDIEREKRSSSGGDGAMSKREVNTAIESSAKDLERELTTQIRDLRKQVETLQRSAKR